MQEECLDVDIVLCNLPFNGAGGRQLFPEKFLKHILEVVPNKTPIVFITPHGFRHNVRKTSDRLSFLSTLEISSIITLPLDVFQNAQIHSEVLIFNMPKIGKAHYTYHPNTQIRKIHTNLKSLCGEPKKCVVLDETFLELSRTIAACLGLQKKSW
ncbi:N-6 DNA methylase [Vibrio parahaemolyticus]